MDFRIGKLTMPFSYSANSKVECRKCVVIDTMVQDDMGNPIFIIPGELYGVSFFDTYRIKSININGLCKFEILNGDDEEQFKKTFLFNEMYGLYLSFIQNKIETGIYKNKRKMSA